MRAEIKGCGGPVEACPWCWAGGGVGPMTWIGSEDRDYVEDGAVLVVADPSAAYSGNTPANRIRGLNAVDDGPAMWRGELASRSSGRRRQTPRKKSRFGRRRGSVLKAQNLTESVAQ
jgi:hypothetical protein